VTSLEVPRKNVKPKSRNKLRDFTDSYSEIERKVVKEKIKRDYESRDVKLEYDSQWEDSDWNNIDAEATSELY
jgi:hypothetical protein